jgi:hypothetical protein
MERLKVVKIDDIEYLISEEVQYDPIQFRVYYNEEGKILFYTCDKLEGNFLIIDAQTYAECRHDLKVIDGKLVSRTSGSIISKYKPNSVGISCSKDDISIVTTLDDVNSKQWKLISYEL